jgi:hypothetical protein
MFIEAVVGFEWVAIIAVSSANVLRVVVDVGGMPAVYRHTVLKSILKQSTRNEHRCSSLVCTCFQGFFMC